MNPQRLPSREAFAYLKKNLANARLDFPFYLQECESYKFSRGISGSVRLDNYCLEADISLRYSPQDPEFIISLHPYFPSIKPSGFDGDLKILAKILRVDPRELLASNRVQRIRDKHEYKRLESLTFLEEKEHFFEHKNLDCHLDLRFGLSGRNFEDTFLSVKDLDIIAGILTTK